MDPHKFWLSLILVITLTFLLQSFPAYRLWLIFKSRSIFRPLTKPLNDFTNLSLDNFNNMSVCNSPIFGGRINVSMQFVPFDQLALKWGLPSGQHTWSGESKFTDVDYTLEYGADEGNQSARIVWAPVSCYQPELTAIIIPFRNRFANLSVFLNHMHPLLRHQRRRYTIFLIEQVKPEVFNRAALFNIGFREASKVANYNCFIFHDIDLLPEDDRMIYGCEKEPLHMTAHIDRHNYSTPYKTIFGGGVAMHPIQFKKARGFPNTYYGWGGEDDDMSRRLRLSKQNILRRNSTVARYKDMKHDMEPGNDYNPKRYRRLRHAREYWQNDTYQHVKYEILQEELKCNGLYYHLNASILQPTFLYSRAIA